MTYILYDTEEKAVIFESQSEGMYRRFLKENGIADMGEWQDTTTKYAILRTLMPIATFEIPNMVIIQPPRDRTSFPSGNMMMSNGLW